LSANDEKVISEAETGDENFFLTSFKKFLSIFLFGKIIFKTFSLPLGDCTIILLGSPGVIPVALVSLVVIPLLIL